MRIKPSTTRRQGHALLTPAAIETDHLRLVSHGHPALWTHLGNGRVMNLPRRRFLHLAAGAATLPAVSRIAKAQSYPARPVRLIVGFAAGGAADIVARLMAQSLSERLGQQFVVENRPGAGTNVGTGVVVNATADGYTLLFVTTPNAINATLYDNLDFNFIRDIMPVAGILRAPLVLVINPSFPAKSVPDLIAHAKANPGQVNMASAGNGSPAHLAGELLKTMAGINMVHVPYRGGAPALTDLLGGQVQVYFSVLPDSMEHIRAGKLRALAVTTATRWETLPDLPTVADFCPATRSVHGKASAHQKIRPPRSSRSLTRRSMRSSPITRSRDGLAISAACRCR